MEIKGFEYEINNSVNNRKKYLNAIKLENIRRVQVNTKKIK